jgi:hypothetical protein
MKSLENPKLLTDFYLMQLAAIPVFVILVMLSIHAIVSPPSSPCPTTSVIERENEITTYHHCNFDKDFFFSIVAVLSAMTFCITKLAYDAREAPMQFNEAKELGMALYTMMLSGLVGVPMIAWLQSRQELVVCYICIAAFATVPVVATVAILFGMRIFTR